MVARGDIFHMTKGDWSAAIVNMVYLQYSLINYFNMNIWFADVCPQWTWALAMTELVDITTLQVVFLIADLGKNVTKEEL